MSAVQENAECRLPFQPAAHPTLDERIISAILKSDAKRVELKADADGNVIIDKDLHPDIYNWVLEG